MQLLKRIEKKRIRRELKMEERADKLFAILASTKVQTSDEFIETFGSILKRNGVIK